MIKSNEIAIILVLLFLTFNCDVVENQRDIPEIKYDEIQIGTQFWMDRNLSETRYRNGDPIPLVTDAEEWEYTKTGAYCYYDNDENNIETYGLLYNWYAVADTRSIAPKGWHIPSYDEWIKLLEYLGGEEVAGNILKEEGTEHWFCPNSNTNESGFSALPGGNRHYYSGHYIYTDIGILACFWTSTLHEYLSNCSKNISLVCDKSEVSNSRAPWNYGYSVRCIKYTYNFPVKSEFQDEKSLIIFK